MFAYTWYTQKYRHTVEHLKIRDKDQEMHIDNIVIYCIYIIYNRNVKEYLVDSEKQNCRII